MSDQDRYLPGVPCWVDTDQPDPDAACTFYGGLFGWQFEDAVPPGAPGTYRIAHLGGGTVGAIGNQPDGGTPPAWNTYVWVTDADETVAKVRAAGGAVLMEPADVGDAGRMAVFADPAGARFSVWQPGTNRGASVVNEHGSLNFNDLHTRDVDAAAVFYGAVFDWELLPIGSGSMWALRPYGDFLEERNPGMRENMASMGAPERFEEVVASVAPAPDDGGGAHWGVTFAVDDADQIAARAEELGGEVLVPPMDAPWVRTTVVTDPWGATFTASTFKPENRDLADDSAQPALSEP